MDIIALDDEAYEILKNAFERVHSYNRLIKILTFGLIQENEIEQYEAILKFIEKHNLNSRVAISIN